MIQAVLFDLDQTLLDRKSSLDAFLRDQWKRFGPKLGKVSCDGWNAKFIALDNQGLTPKSEVYLQVLREFGGDTGLDKALLQDYSLRFCEHARGFPEMEATLNSLRDHGLKLGIITNGETEFQSRSISALGLWKYVDEALISQSEGLRKPDPTLFLRAADRLGLAVGNCLFVGDNPVADILGAYAAGMKTMWFAQGRDWPEAIAPNPGAKIEALAQVPDMASKIG